MARPTIHDVAREAGVSIATVSYVLNNRGSVAPATRERVLSVARNLNYRPSMTARNLQANETRLFAYSWRPAPADSFNPILDQFLRSMAQSAAHHGYRLLVYPTDSIEQELAAYQTLVGENRVDGIVLSNTNYGDPRISRLQQWGFPFVCFGRTGEESRFPWVDVDGHAGALAATRHLLEMGHRQIVALGWPQGSLAGHHRLNGFRAAMQEAGIADVEAQIVRAENLQEAAREAVRPLLMQRADKRPTAILAVSDLMAIGVLNVAEELGLHVGRDLALVGFDDSPISRFLRPTLSSLAQPVEEVGERLIAMLAALCNGNHLDPREVLLTPTLVVRESSGFQREP